MASDAALSQASVWRFGNAVVDERNRTLQVDGAAVELENRPFDVLLCLLRAEGDLVTKAELFDTVWAGRIVTDASLSKTIKQIRAALHDSDRSIVRTVHGHGFRLDAELNLDAQGDNEEQTLEYRAGMAPPGLDGWVLESRLTAESANEVWRIRDTASGEFAVLKLALDARGERALRREVTLSRVLAKELGDDAPLAALSDWQFESKPCWVKMPWFAAGSLADWFTAKKSTQGARQSDRIRMVAEVAAALAGAHAIGVMHKDIKPQNLLVDASGPRPRALLCDFGSGMARSRERLARAGITIMGFTHSVMTTAGPGARSGGSSNSPMYLAPELLSGATFTERAEVFALGVVLYQLLAGDMQRPLAQGWEDDIDNPHLRRVIAGACAGRPERRTASMADLSRELRELLAAPAPGPASRPADITLPPPPRQRRSWPTILLAGALAGAGLMWAAQQSNPRDSGLAPLTAKQIASRVAVLPFDFVGLDPHTSRVLSGLQDALATELSGHARWRLVADRTLGRVRLSEMPAVDIGRRLGVGRLVHGAIVQDNGALRVDLQIIDAGSGEILWADALQSASDDLFAVQERIGSTLHAGLSRLSEQDATDAVSTPE